eukprot:COSAG01_NODE_70633_length_258_cov_0.641509_1_plen_35_part_01
MTYETPGLYGSMHILFLKIQLYNLNCLILVVPVDC